MRLPDWLRTRSTRRTAGTLTVTLTADTTQFVTDLAALAEEQREALSRAKLTNRIHRERRIGLDFVNQLVDDMARDLGFASEGHCGKRNRCSSTTACPCGQEVLAERVCS